AFLAATERKMGQYEAALALLQPLVRAYPRDRLLWFDAGMCHYLSGRYEEASRAFLSMLDIDPDDLAAHYNLMRSLRRLHRVSEARREEVIYQTLREDDNAKQIGLAYLRTHSLADRETRTVHEHSLAPGTRAFARDEGKGPRDEKGCDSSLIPHPSSLHGALPQRWHRPVPRCHRLCRSGCAHVRDGGRRG